MCETVGGDIFERARAGDPDAFDRLLETLQPPLARFVERLVGGAEDAEDVAQDAFFALRGNLGKLAGPGHVRPFLFRVARNLCYDELRRQGRFDRVSLDDLDDEAETIAFEAVAARNGHPEELAHWLHLWTCVRAAMDRLPEMQRQTLILYAEADLAYEEIASAMNTEIGTVKSRIHYGRRNLLRLLPPDVREAVAGKETRR